MWSRDVLNRLKWHPEETLDDVEIKIIHRGGEGNLKIFKGTEIEKLEKSFFVTKDDTWIPYHRIVEIKRKDEILWKKEI